MKAEDILKSNMLDIVFENRNKAYGAYYLRRYYNNRLIRAIGFTSLIVIIFAVLQSWKVPHRIGSIAFQLDSVHLTTIELLRDKPIVKELPKPAVQHRNNVATVNTSVPVVVPDKFVDKTMPDVAQIDTSLAGTKNLQGLASIGEVGITSGESTPALVSGNGNADKPEEVAITKPFDRVEYMPEFPSGKEAYVKFMKRNLRQPDDIENEKIVVIAKFVVQADGSISDLNIIQNGRVDLNEEVLRVLHKMPKWKPGMQNGRAVPVYFRVPITFMPAE